MLKHLLSPGGVHVQRRYRGDPDREPKWFGHATLVQKFPIAQLTSTEQVSSTFRAVRSSARVKRQRIPSPDPRGFLHFAPDLAIAGRAARHDASALVALATL